MTENKIKELETLRQTLVSSLDEFFLNIEWYLETKHNLQKSKLEVNEDEEPNKQLKKCETYFDRQFEMLERVDKVLKPIEQIDVVMLHFEDVKRRFLMECEKFCNSNSGYR